MATQSDLQTAQIKLKIMEKSYASHELGKSG
jgi:hypothetical protein